MDPMRRGHRPGPQYLRKEGFQHAIRPVVAALAPKGSVRALLVVTTVRYTRVGPYQKTTGPPRPGRLRTRSAGPYPEWFYD